jgi:glutamate/tyrosine decarboxylase-like PLP-dependent enzyme
MNLINTPEELREMGRVALDHVVSYYQSLSDGSRLAFRPVTSARLRDVIEEPLPQQGTSFEEALGTIYSLAADYSRHSAHQRLFGYVCSPGTALNAAGSLVATALNVNVTGFRSAPAATEIEKLVIRWLAEMIGYPGTAAGGILVSGGSMANFAGLAAARSAKAPHDVVREGVAGPRMCAYVSEEGHFSIRKAAGMLGLGTNNVRSVRTNHRQQMDLDDLARLVHEDRVAGHLPFCVVAAAGTVGSGAVDPLSKLAQFARDENLWLHVDGAYGAFAAMAPATRHLFDGLAEADSVALDPHKWLYLPMGTGCILFRDPATARAAFAENADYIRVMGLGQDEAFVFWDYGPELSRPFRAFDIWLLVKTVGVQALAEAIAENIACAKYFEDLVRTSDDFEMLAPVVLSIFCFRYRPPGFKGDLDALNEQVMLAVQRSGASYVSNARIAGEFALRGCVLNYRTTRRDMEILLEDIRRAAASVRP